MTMVVNDDTYCSVPQVLVLGVVSLIFAGFGCARRYFTGGLLAR